MSAIEVKVPDIGDFKDVAVIEVLVKPGDTVKAEDRWSRSRSRQGDDGDPVVACRRRQGGEGQGRRQGQRRLGDRRARRGRRGAAPAPRRSAGALPAPAPAPRSRAGAAAAARTARRDRRRAGAGAPARRSAADVECDLLVLGAGPGGYSAAFRAADLGMKVGAGRALRDARRRLPQRRLHPVEGAAARRRRDGRGRRTSPSTASSFGAPKVDLAKLRAHKNKVVGKLTGGLAGMAKMRKVTVVRGVGEFLDPHHVEVELTEGDGQAKTGKKQIVRFEQAIIAAGSQAVQLPFMPEDPRIVDSTGALELPSMPKRMLVVGGGIIGLEMGTVYSTLGARLDVVEMLDGLMQGADRDLVKVWQKLNAPRFDNIMLKTKTVAAEAHEGRHPRDASRASSAPKEPQLYDLVLQAVGRSPNGKKIGADKAGVARHRSRLHPGRHPDAHQRAAHLRDRRHRRPADARAQGGARGARRRRSRPAGRRKSLLRRARDPGVAYTDPGDRLGRPHRGRGQGARASRSSKGLFPWAASGRAIANGRDEGFTKLLFDDETHRIVGGGIVGTHAGDLISEIALAIEMGADAVDIGKTIHPHPTLGESVGLAAEAFEGVCTDLPPARR